MFERWAFVLALSGVALVCPDASAAPGTSQTVPDLETLHREAFVAYESGEFREAAGLFETAAAAATGISVANDLYNAGCCLARAGDVDEALAMLERAIEAGYANADNLASDSDLAALREDPRLAELQDRVARPAIVITENVQVLAEDAEFVFEDVDHFLTAMAKVDRGGELVSALETEYFARATPGLHEMIRKYPFTPEDLADAIRRDPRKYGEVSRHRDLLESRVDEFREAYGRFAELYPEVVFPPTYFLVDCDRGIGSGSPEGSLISIERRTPESIAGLETLLVHELVHFQQLSAVGVEEFYALFAEKKTLLGLALREGTAEFIARRVTGRTTQEDAWVWLLGHEAETWTRFRNVMMASDTRGWMWSAPGNSSQPRDLAYAIGARIVESYCSRADGPERAVRAAMSVTEPAGFLEASGYTGEPVGE